MPLSQGNAPLRRTWGAVFLNRFDQRIVLRARLTLHTIKSPSTPEYGELSIVQHELNELFAAR